MRIHTLMLQRAGEYRSVRTAVQAVRTAVRAAAAVLNMSEAEGLRPPNGECQGVVQLSMGRMESCGAGNGGRKGREGRTGYQRGRENRLCVEAMPSAEGLIGQERAGIHPSPTSALPEHWIAVTTPMQSAGSSCSPQLSHQDGLTRRWAIRQPLESLRQGMGDGRDEGKVPGRAGQGFIGQTQNLVDRAGQSYTVAAWP